MFNSSQFSEYQPVERALSYDETALSLRRVRWFFLSFLLFHIDRFFLQASIHSMEYLLLNRALHAVCEFVDDSVRYAIASPFQGRYRPRSVHLPLKEVKVQRTRALSVEPPTILWRRPSLPEISKKIMEKKLAWKRIKYAVARIDCWNRNYRRPPLRRVRLKTPKIFYQPKPYDTWNEESIPTSTPRNIPSRIERVEAKPRIDTWLRKPYQEPVSTVKIINQPIQVTGKSKVDSWMKRPIRRARSAIEVNPCAHSIC